MDELTECILKADKDETKFSILLLSRLPDNFRIKRTYDEHTVDYFIYKNEKLLCYVELKTRYNAELYVRTKQSLMIGATKIDNIDRMFKKTILVWFCEKTKNYYFSHYVSYFKDLPKYKLQHWSVDREDMVRYIPISNDNVGFENLIHEIINYE